MSFFLLAACCTISGSVHAVSGAALAAAQVVVRSGAASDSANRTTTDSGGGFSLDEPPGAYSIATSANGFAPVTVFLKADRDLTVQIVLEPLDSPKLRQIGSVRVDGRLAPIQGAIPSIALTRADLDALGDNRIAQGLEELPSATFTRPDGGAASAVAVVSLRGPDPSESLLALDGQLLNDGNTGDVDLSRLPVAAFSAVSTPMREIGTGMPMMATFTGSFEVSLIHLTATGMSTLKSKPVEQ